MGIRKIADEFKSVCREIKQAWEKGRAEANKKTLFSETGLAECTVLGNGHIMVNGFITCDYPMTRRDIRNYKLRRFWNAITTPPEWRL